MQNHTMWDDICRYIVASPSAQEVLQANANAQICTLTECFDAWDTVGPPSASSYGPFLLMCVAAAVWTALRPKRLMDVKASWHAPARRLDDDDAGVS